MEMDGVGRRGVVGRQRGTTRTVGGQLYHARTQANPAKALGFSFGKRNCLFSFRKRNFFKKHKKRS